MELGATGIRYQTFINLYLCACAANGRRLSVESPARKTGAHNATVLLSGLWIAGSSSTVFGLAPPLN